MESIGFQRQFQKDKELVEEAKSFIHRPERELKMNPALEKKSPVASTSSNPAPEVSKEKPKGPQKKQRGPKRYQVKGKVKANWHRHCPQGYRIPKLDTSAVDSVFNMARALMEFTAKEQEEIKRTFPHK
ncbi:hypothetical protein O181_033647 [Austropuccinia psidii MF-1]|uniref:Uncharacterized protein n=1 Tax=Austropuccinia psidii MF-1 TaxID=1389203 RepID=A0A9Q3H7C9_9BASI|nr:hypothetical protein [Austropuccinia psidii MF-1]